MIATLLVKVPCTRWRTDVNDCLHSNTEIILVCTRMQTPSLFALKYRRHPCLHSNADVSPCIFRVSILALSQMQTSILVHDSIPLRHPAAVLLFARNNAKVQ